MSTNVIGRTEIVYGPNGKNKGRKEIFGLPDGQEFYRDRDIDGSDKFIKFSEQENRDNQTGGSDRWFNLIRGYGQQPEKLLTGNDLILAKQLIAGIGGASSTNLFGGPPSIVTPPTQTPLTSVTPTPAAQTTGPDHMRAVTATRIATGGNVESGRGKSEEEIAARVKTQQKQQFGETLGGRTGSELPDDVTPAISYAAEASRRQAFAQTRTRMSSTSPYAAEPDEIPQTYIPREQRPRTIRVTSPSDSHEPSRPSVGTTSLTRAQASRRPEAKTQTASERLTSSPEPTTSSPPEQSRSSSPEPTTSSPEPTTSSPEPTTSSPEPSRLTIKSRQPEPTPQPRQQTSQESSEQVTQQTTSRLPETRPKSIIKQSNDLTVKPQKKTVFVPDVSSFLDKARTLASDNNTVVKGIHPSNKKPNIATIIIIIVGVIGLFLVLLITGSPPFHARHAPTKDVEKFYDIVKSGYLFPKNKEIPDDYGSYISI